MRTTSTTSTSIVESALISSQTSDATTSADVLSCLYSNPQGFLHVFDRFGVLLLEVERNTNVVVPTFLIGHGIATNFRILF